MKNHEGTPNPAAGAAAPKREMNDVKFGVMCTMQALRPLLARMDIKTRKDFSQALSGLLNNHPTSMKENDESPDRNAAYASILKAPRTQDSKETMPPVEEPVEDDPEDSPDPEETSEKGLKVPSLEEIDQKGMKLVYICAPFWAHGEEERQRKLIKMESLSWFACTQGMIPVAPHLMYPAFLQDDDEDENCYGFVCSMRLLSLCDEVWVLEDCGITREMEFELRMARKFGLPVRFFSRGKA